MRAASLLAGSSCVMLALLAVVIVIGGTARADTLNWATRPTTNLLTSSDAATVNGVTITSSGATSGTFNTRLIQIQPTSSSNGTTGFIFSQMDAATDNGTSAQTTTISFSEPVYNLSFTVLDIDGGPSFNDGTNAWNDIVDFSSDAGVPTSATAAANVSYNASTGRATATANANLTDGSGNITVTFAGPVNAITVSHIAGAVPGTNNPTNQFVFIDDLTYARSPRLTLTKVSNGGTGTFDFSGGTNGFGTDSITTSTSGVGVAGATKRLTSIATSTSVTETVPANWALTGATCTGMGSGGTATLTGNTLELNAAAITAGANIACTLTNTRATLKVQKISVGGTGNFSFSSTNLASAPGNITTSTAGVAAPASPTAINISTLGTAVTITETTLPAGYSLTNAECTDANAAVTGNTGNFGSFSGTTLTVPASTISAGADITCVLTNTRAVVRVEKISKGGIGSFSFSDSNLTGTIASIATTAADTPTSASNNPRIVNNLNNQVTITETPAAGFSLTSAICTDANAAVTGNTGTFGNLAGNTLTITTANINSGADITCTFTNTRASVRFQKTTLGGTGTFSFTRPPGSNLAATPAAIVTTAVATPSPSSPTAVNVSAVNTAVNLTETPAAGYALTGFSCTDTNSAYTGNTGSFGSFSGNTVTIPAANVRTGSDLSCVITNSRTPTVKVQKITQGGVSGPFSFAQTNLASTPAAITTTTEGVAAPASPTAINVSTTGADVTLTETVATGYFITSASCTDANGAVTGNTGVIGSLSGTTLTIPAANVVAGADFNCVFANTLAVPQLTVTKTASVANADASGDTIIYTISVSNSGNVTVGSITVGDPLGAVTCQLSGNATIATLAPGVSETCSLTYTVTQADLDSNGGGDGDLDNTATATGTYNAQPVQATGSAAVPLIIAPGVSVAKTANDTTDVIAGQTITYTYVVTNTGNQTISNIALADTHNAAGPAPVPGLETLTIDVGPSGDSTDTTPSDGVWTTLAPGDAVTFTATHIVSQSDVDNLQ